MNDKEYLITIIVPVYNVEDFLEQCLNSIIPLKDCGLVKVLCINDGSTDNSEEILRKITKEHNGFFNYINKVNGGLSDARNTGIKNCDTEYISFVDSDDWIDPEAFYKILTLIQETNAEIIISDYIEVFNNNHTIVNDINVGNNIVYQATVCNKFFSRKLFLDNNITFPKDLWYEDNETCYKLLMMADKIVYVDEVSYFYRQNREGSITNTTSEKIYDINIIAHNLSEFIKYKNLDIETIEDLEFIFIRNVLFRTLPKILQLERKKPHTIKTKIKKQYEILESYFPNWKDNNILKEDKYNYFRYRIGNNHVNKLVLFEKSLLYFLFTIIFNYKKIRIV